MGRATSASTPRVETIEPLESRRLLSISLLSDFNTTTASSWAREPVVLDGLGYFYANDGVHGRELWKTDGTLQGTSLAVDINSGPGSSGGFDLHEAGGLLYFSAHDASGNVDIWRSDGTTAGTFKLTSVATSNEQFLIENVASVNGAAVFGSYHHGLWRSDGTAAGTERIAPLRARNMVRLNDALFFMATPMEVGPAALWKTDGTAAGTTIVRQFSSPWATTIFQANGRLYFGADDSTINAGFEPWSSDGTAEGTVPLGDLNPGPGSSALLKSAVLDGAVYFIITEDPDSRRMTLIRTDGTPGSATVVADLGQYNSFSYEQPDIVVFGGAMYFRGSRAGVGSELWRSDGTPQGTHELIDLNPGAASSYPTALQVYNGRLYFKAQTATDGFEMYSTDGTAEGTMLLKSIAPGSRGIDRSYSTVPTVFNDRLFFRADDVLHGMELWSTDGTAAGTTLLKDIRTNTNDFNPSSFTAGPGGFHYFIADDGVRGTELWKTDGTAAGTSPIRNFTIIPPWYIGPFVYANGLLLFGARDSGGAGYELWRSDGTAAGTYVVKDIAPGTANGLGSALIKVGDRVFFRATTSTASYPRYDLWVSDGTEEGTRLVKASDNEFALEQFSGIELDGKLVFHATSATPAEWAYASIFVSDGTYEGTVHIKDGFANVPVTGWTIFNGKAYFAATTAAEGKELWTTDGTEEGTVIVADIHPGPGSSSPDNLVATPNDLYFTAINPTEGRELWRVNRLRAGPVGVTALPSDVKQVQATVAGGVIFTTEAGGIYRFDGSQVIPLKTSGFTAVPTLLGGDVRLNYFSARTDAAGTELWETDGTADGTRLVHDLLPGPGGSFPQNLGVIGRTVLFSAATPSVGRELFVVSPLQPAAGASLGTARTIDFGFGSADGDDDENFAILT